MPSYREEAGRLDQNLVPPEATCDPSCSLELLINIVSNLIIVQQVATYPVYYIYVGSSTCFGC